MTDIIRLMELVTYRSGDSRRPVTLAKGAVR